MRYIFVDFEMNPVNRKYTEVRQICRNEIIEIGASMLDDNMNEISSFRIYVRPQYNDEIAPYCRELTGITMNRLFCADHFPEAFHKFSEWCRSEGEDVQLFAWSGSDLLQLREQMNLYGIVMTDEVRYMTENWKDFQEEYRQIAGEEDFPSLDRALNMVGCSFTGTRHDALWDARNTADLFVLTRDLEDFQKKREKIREAMEPKPLSCSLGSFFTAEKRKVFLESFC